MKRGQGVLVLLIGSGIVWIWTKIKDPLGDAAGAIEETIGGAAGSIASWFYGGDVQVESVYATWFTDWYQARGIIPDQYSIFPPAYAGDYAAWRESMTALFYDSTASLSIAGAAALWNWLNGEHSIDLPLPSEWSR